MATPLTHCEMSQFKSHNNQLLVNNIPLTRLAQRAGQTPFYAYDRSVIQQKIDELRQTFENEASIHYAIKANPMPALVDFIADKVDGLDVASGKELTTALNSGKSPACISFAGPGKNEKELLMALAAGITINIESNTELERIIQLSEQHNLTANVAVRINPDFELKTSGMRMAGGAQQFGIDAEQAPLILERIKAASLNFRGLHIFTGSQNLNPTAICEAHNNIYALAESISASAKMPLPTLNIGGGFGIPYFPGELHLNLQPVAENIKRLNQQYSTQLKQTDIILELGRYLVGEAGIFVSKVTDIKQSREQTFAIIDGGLHHHLAASGNFGQVIRKNYPVAIGNKMDKSKDHSVSIVGPLCTPLDLLAKNMPLPTIEIDDLVVIYQSGAYGFTASPRDFLSHNPPVELLV
jgi:diaminopimelate decarboxylase